MLLIKPIIDFTIIEISFQFDEFAAGLIEVFF